MKLIKALTAKLVSFFRPAGEPEPEPVKISIVRLNKYGQAVRTTIDPLEAQTSSGKFVKVPTGTVMFDATKDY